MNTKSHTRSEYIANLTLASTMPRTHTLLSSNGWKVGHNFLVVKKQQPKNKSSLSRKS